jgi:hypothetical protein
LYNFNLRTFDEFICLDPHPSLLGWKLSNATYSQLDFQDFDFSRFSIDNSLCFFDDHQNTLRRLQQMLWKGFKRAIIEDNYPETNVGDCYSPRKALAGVGLPLGQAKDGVGVAPTSAHNKELYANLKTYWEFPPLIREAKNRFGGDWTEVPIKREILANPNLSEFQEELSAYTHIAFVEIK